MFDLDRLTLFKLTLNVTRRDQTEQGRTTWNFFLEMSILRVVVARPVSLCLLTMNGCKDGLGVKSEDNEKHLDYAAL